VSSGGAAVQSSWATTRERGALVLMRLAVIGLKLLSRPLTVPIVHVVTLYFFLFGRRARANSRDYLRRIAREFPESGLTPTWGCSYRHFVAFAHAILDKLNAWSGRLEYRDIAFEDHEALRRAASSGRGVLVIGSHLGNLEVCRALASLNRRVRLNVLVHTRHAAYFTRMLAMAGASQVELLQVTDFGAATALTLRERIDRGEWVVIAADRVPVHGGRTVDVRFLGGIAPLPVGPYVLAALLDCPVHLLFCLRRSGRNHVYFERFTERFAWDRSERDALLQREAQRFADRLAHYVRLEPLQWFNFYPFWRGDAAEASAGSRTGAQRQGARP
jgi:predicted LPLAT superfamily acyltransferase